MLSITHANTLTGMEVHLRDVRYFVAVADELSVARAAERLYVSQPAVSKQVRGLERRIGFPLFDRGPDGLSLTPEGGALLAQAREILSRWEDAVEAARSAGDHTIVVGLQTAIGHALTRALHASMAGSNWTLTLKLVPWADPTAGLADGTSDAAIVWEPTDQRLDSQVLGSERRCVAVPAQHRLAGRKTVRFEEIAGEPMIALPESTGPLRAFWLGADRRNGEPATVRAEAATRDRMVELVSRGIGLALVAESHRHTCAHPGVVIVPVDDLAPAELRLAWRGRRAGEDPHGGLAAVMASSRTWPLATA